MKFTHHHGLALTPPHYKRHQTLHVLRLPEPPLPLPPATDPIPNPNPNPNPNPKFPDRGHAMNGTPGLDLYAQARKALAERSPFDGEEAAGRVTTLPVALAASLARWDRRKKEDGEKATTAGRVWDETEEYFRDVRLEDVERLVRLFPEMGDSCFMIPVPGPEPPPRADGDEPACGNVGSKEESGSVPASEDGNFGGKDEPSSVAVSEDDKDVRKEELLCVPERADDSKEGTSVPVIKEEIVEVVEAAVNEEKVGLAAEDREMDVAPEGSAAEDGNEHSHESMDIDSGGVTPTKCDESVQLQEERGGESLAPLNWLLGSEHRALLTSERPNKKRKLLGSDAGLERLLNLPQLDNEDLTACDFCCASGDPSSSNGLLTCDSCKMSVHRSCYGVVDNPNGTWICSWCQQSDIAGVSSNVSAETPCVLCPKKGGALKMVGGNGGTSGINPEFVHLFCCLWMPEIYVDNIEAMELIMNVDAVPETRRKLVCHVCKMKHGACVRCSHGTCRASFHPICAREAKHRLEIWGKAGCDNVELRVFCSKHSAQRVIDSSMNMRNGCAESNYSTVRPPVSKVTELRFTRRSREKNIFQQNSSPSDENVKSGSPKKETISSVKLKSGGPDAKVDNMERENLDNEAIKDIPPVSYKSLLFLKKLIERGKMKTNDVSSKIGISTESLEAVLSGEPKSLSPQIHLKINKWVNDTVRMVAPGYLKTRSDYKAISSDEGTRNDSNDGYGEIPKGSGAACGAAFETQFDDVRVESSSEIMKKSSMKLSETFSSHKDSVLQHHQNNGNSFDETKQNSFIVTDEVKDLSCTTSIADQDSAKRKKVGNVADVVPSVVSDAVCVDRVTSLSKGFTVGRQDTVSGACSASYVHPFIKKKFLQTYSAVKEQVISDGFKVSSIEASITAEPLKGYLEHLTSPTGNELDSENKECLIEKPGVLEALANVKDVGVMELSLVDELEGEIVHLQNKLLSSVVEIKHQCDCLIYKLCSNLSKELEVLKKQRWDSLIANRFLRDIREAKKRGRRERRHQKAQSILAAANAAAALSSVSPVQKDDNSNHQGILKVESARENVRSYSPIKLQGKPKSSKLSTKKNADAPPRICDVCNREESNLNTCFVCVGCKVEVHLDCYHRGKDLPRSSFYCDSCEESRTCSSSPRSISCDVKDGPSFRPQCCLCGATCVGAFRKSVDGQWMHAFCAEWILESTFKRGQENAVEGMNILRGKDELSCSVCHQKAYFCIKCSYGHCQTAFHPVCARRAGLYMSAKMSDGSLQHRAYCQKHSKEQKDKAESLQHGTEELKSVRQIRVELEKLRLLCDRIVKREKLKRDLVVCSHEILSSRRDATAFSMLTEGGVLSVGVSSESVTTSLNNTSFNEAVERSDDISVDSNASGKMGAVHLPHVKTDRRLNQRSRSHIPFTRKVAERTLFSDKQLPQRPVPPDHANTSDEDNKTKFKKRTENFQKEVIMTSDQASIQNQRLPKGFVYVPVDTLSKSEDLDYRGPPKPDG